MPGLEIQSLPRNLELPKLCQASSPGKPTNWFFISCSLYAHQGFIRGDYSKHASVCSIAITAEVSVTGYEEAQPMVFCGMFPTDADQYNDMREALGRLQLNDAALSFEPEVGSCVQVCSRMHWAQMVDLFLRNVDVEYLQLRSSCLPAPKFYKYDQVRFAHCFPWFVAFLDSLEVPPTWEIILAEPELNMEPYICGQKSLLAEFSGPDHPLHRHTTPGSSLVCPSWKGFFCFLGNRKQKKQ